MSEPAGRALRRAEPRARARPVIPSSASWTTMSACNRAGSPRCETHGASGAERRMHRRPAPSRVAGSQAGLARSTISCTWSRSSTWAASAGDSTRRLRVGYAWGGNMSIRIQPALSLGGFDPDRGVRPDGSLGPRRGAGAAAPFRRGRLRDLVRARGRRFAPRPAGALTEDYFVDAFRARGRSEARGGKGRARGLATLGRGLARYGALAALRRPEAPTARFTCAYGWALLTTSRDPRPPAAAL